MQLAEAKVEGKAHYTTAQIVSDSARSSTRQTGFNEVLQSLLAQTTETPLTAELGAATALWKVQPDTPGEKELPMNQKTLGKRLFLYIPSSVQDVPHRNGVTITNCLSLLPYPHTYSPAYLLKDSSYIHSILSGRKNSISDNECFITETKLPTQERKAGTNQ